MMIHTGRKRSRKANRGCCEVAIPVSFIDPSRTVPCSTVAIHIDTCQYEWVGKRPYTKGMVSSHGMTKNPYINECCSLSNGPLDQDNAVHFAQQFKVLADPARLRLLSILCDEGCGPMSVSELTALSGLSQPTVSHHLAKLRDADLLAKRQTGRTVTHEVQKQAFTALRELLSFD